MTKQVRRGASFDPLIILLIASFSGVFIVNSTAALEAQSPPQEIADRNALITSQPPRISPLTPEHFTPEQQAVFVANAGIAPTASSSSGSNTLLVDMVGTLARAPSVYAPHMDSARAFFTKSSLTPRDREIVILRTAWLSQSPYEWGEHVRIAKDCGISDVEIERATLGSDSEGWSNHDRALVQAAEQLHSSSFISDETWEQLSQSYDEQQLIELILLIGQYKTVAYYLNTLRIKLREGSPGLLAR